MIKSMVPFFLTQFKNERHFHKEVLILFKEVFGDNSTFPKEYNQNPRSSQSPAPRDTTGFVLLGSVKAHQSEIPRTA